MTTQHRKRSSRALVQQISRAAAASLVVAAIFGTANLARAHGVLALHYPRLAAAQMLARDLPPAFPPGTHTSGNGQSGADPLTAVPIGSPVALPPVNLVVTQATDKLLTIVDAGYSPSASAMPAALTLRDSMQERDVKLSTKDLPKHVRGANVGR